MDDLMRQLQILIYDARHDADKLNIDFNGNDYKWELGYGVYSLLIYKCGIYCFENGINHERFIYGIRVEINKSDANVIKLWRNIK